MWHAAGIVASALAAALMSRTEAPWHVAVWIVLVPWLLALDRLRSMRAALGSGVLMAIAFSVAVFWWFPLAMADYATAPLWAAAAIGLVAAPIFQPQLVAFALARQAARQRGLGAAGTAIVGACTYVAAEWAIPKLLGDSLGLALLPARWLRQAADVAGVGGLTLAVVLGNECVRAIVVSIAERANPRRALAPLASLVLVIGGLATYGALRVAALDARPSAPAITVGIVQADVAHYDRLAAEIGTYAAVRRILDAHFALSDALIARGVDVLVWPETVYPTTFGSPKSADGAAFDRAIGGLVAKNGRPLVFGSYDAEDGHEYNAAVFLEPAAGDVTFATYRKASLFPLTEEVPGWIDGPRLRAWLPWLGSWHPGTGAAVVDFTIPGKGRIRVAPLICYDAVHPEHVARAVRDGAEIIMTLSNDSWLADGAGARLHFVVSVFRSIETRRPQVRATTTGISAVVTPAGDVVAHAGVHERSALAAAVAPVRDVPPLAVRWGNWLGPCCAAIAAVMLGLGARRG
jgi:apolipoprotein N-acyltransferase